jgi:hypothetical protein
MPAKAVQLSHRIDWFASKPASTKMLLECSAHKLIRKSYLFSDSYII